MDNTHLNHQADTIVEARFVSKPVDWRELQAYAKDAALRPARVVEVIELTSHAFDSFCSRFLARTAWLAGKGGGGSVINAIEVRAPNRPRLLVNPEGYDYARCVAILSDAA